jgi:hypothetical protein
VVPQKAQPPPFFRRPHPNKFSFFAEASRLGP